jgi:hypothetical protein
MQTRKIAADFSSTIGASDMTCPLYADRLQHKIPFSQKGSVQQYTGEPAVDNIVNPATATDVSYEPPLDNLETNEILRIVRVVYGVSIRRLEPDQLKPKRLSMPISSITIVSDAIRALTGEPSMKFTGVPYPNRG